MASIGTPSLLNRLRAAVILVMAAAMMVFTTAAEARATMLVKMAEESGIARFYEDKLACPHQEVVRLAETQHTLEPEEQPAHVATIKATPAAPRGVYRRWSPSAPRGPPHLPRAPPVAA